ncbi:MAG: sigma-70 family RNA polymerase sigma factor [Gemmatimonadota bacterium]
MTDALVPRGTPPTSLAALKRGDPAAMAVAYERHAPALLRTLTIMLGERSEAEDVVHDLFVGLPEAMARYEERGQFGGWLHRIAVRLAISRLRRRGRRGEVAIEAADGVGHRAEGEAVADQITVTDALATLPESLRVVVVLREYEGWSHREIAAHLGISEGAAMTRHCRALQKLRRTLEGDR